MNVGLLGDFQLRVAEQPVVLAARKNRALLAWLLCQGAHPTPRDRLAGLLWGDRSAANARASLRQALAGLRKVLPEGVLQASSTELSIDHTRIRCDVLQLRSAIGQPNAKGLRPVLELYQGDLLDGFSASAAPFDEWLLLEREQLRQSATVALRKLLGMEEEGGADDRAIEVAGRLLSLDPLQEDVHRSLMRLFATRGQLGAARRQFRLCRDVLEAELQRPPSRETLALFQALGSESASGPAAATRPADRAGDAVETVPPDASAPVDRRAALPSLAVLPFRSTSAENDHAYLADGMTEELINLLTSSASWRVAGRSQSFHYRGADVQIEAVREGLGVAYVIEGVVRTAGNRVRVNVALVDTNDGAQLWAQRYDRPLDDVFEIQDDVAHAIFRTLKHQLGFAERERVRRAPRTSLNAWGLLMRAMQIQVVNSATRQAQLDLVEESVAVDPEYPRAHAYLASLLFASVGRRTSPDPQGDLARAREHLDAALQRGAADAVTLRLGAGGLAAVGEAPHTLALAQRAYELRGRPDPLLVAALTWNGQLDEAFRHCELLLQDLPDDAPVASGEFRPLGLLGNLHLLRGDLEQALHFVLRDQRSNPGNFFAHVNVANVYGLLGNIEEARKAWQLATAIVPTLKVKQIDLGYRKVCTDPELGARYAAGLLQADVDAASEPS
ncbi:MAG: BTAD domain-containing putative transcriptional regulator [Pseudomonadota bacterium]